MTPEFYREKRLKFIETWNTSSTMKEVSDRLYRARWGVVMMSHRPCYYRYYRKPMKEHVCMLYRDRYELYDLPSGF